MPNPAAVVEATDLQATVKGTKPVWIVATIGVIWLAVLSTAIFAPDVVTGSEQQHFNVAAFTNWFWGLLATVFLLRATVFRSPQRGVSDEEAAWVWISVAVEAIWVAVMLISILVPEAVTGTDPTRIPIAAIVAPIVAVVFTKYVCEFLVYGFSARATKPHVS